MVLGAAMEHVFLVYSGAHDNRGVEAVFATKEEAFTFAQALAAGQFNEYGAEVERRNIGKPDEGIYESWDFP